MNELARQRKDSLQCSDVCVMFIHLADGSPCALQYLPTGYSAAKGWDPVTGFGSLNYGRFAASFA